MLINKKKSAQLLNIYENLINFISVGNANIKIIK